MDVHPYNRIMMGRGGDGEGGPLGWTVEGGDHPSIEINLSRQILIISLDYRAVRIVLLRCLNTLGKEEIG